MWLFALFVAIPLIEIALFVTVGGWLGLWTTLLVVLGSAMLGLFIMRQQGERAMQELRGSVRMQGGVKPLAENALLVLAGGLLILPGFLTDTLGLLLLIRPLRLALIGFLASRMAGHATFHDLRDPGRREDGIVIDAEYIELDPDTRPKRGPSRWTEH